MAKFKITYGVYNDITEELIEVNTLKQAEEDAYLAATQVFESYGIYEQEMEDDEKEWDEEDYNECRERWIEYVAEEVPDDYVLED